MFKDVRLLSGLDANIHFTEVREVILFPTLRHQGSGNTADSQSDDSE